MTTVVRGQIATISESRETHNVQQLHSNVDWTRNICQQIYLITAMIGKDTLTYVEMKQQPEKPQFIMAMQKEISNHENCQHYPNANPLHYWGIHLPVVYAFLLNSTMRTYSGFIYFNFSNDVAPFSPEGPNCHNHFALFVSDQWTNFQCLRFSWSEISFCIAIINWGFSGCCFISTYVNVSLPIIAVIR